MPLISIIVPVYNVEDYLPKCIDSILNQTLTEFELILVNDGSLDNCPDICEEYAQKDSRIKVIHKSNGGLSDARNTGINAAQGEYIGFVDSDDWIEPEMYEVLYGLCRTHHADVSTCSINIWDENKEKRLRSASGVVNVLDSKTAIHHLYDGKLSGFPAWNKLYKREVFKEIRFPKSRIYEDAAIMYKVYDYADKVVYIDQPLYNYIYRKAGITKSEFSEKRFDVVHNYHETYSYMKENIPELCEKVNQAYLTSLRMMILELANEKRIRRNMRYVKKVSSLIRKSNRMFLTNSSISIKHKLFAQVLAWFPLMGMFCINCILAVKKY